MKVSSYFFFFILFGLLSTGFFFASANAQTEVSHYFEENDVCTVITTSAQPVVISDGIDFEFEDGSDYLIVATSMWGADDNALTFEINLQHNATIFEGSQQITEPKTSSNGCGVDKEYYKYFFWTIWSPVGVTEASEDISLNYISNSGKKMMHDDVTIFVMDMENITENTNWFYAEDTTDKEISSLMTMSPEATFIGSDLDGEFTEQPAKFFSDNKDENDDGFVDCIRVFDVALNSTTAKFVTNSTNTCFPFPDTSIPVPIRIFDLNGNATDLKGGTDLQLSDGGTGLNATGWNFLEADDAQIVPSDIPNTEYAIEMVLSFDNFTTDPSTFVFPRILDFHNNEGAFDGKGKEYGIHGDEVGQTQDVGIWFWDVQGLGVGFGGVPMTNNTLSHILMQRNSTGFVEVYKDGELAFAFDDTGESFDTDSLAKLTFTPNNNDDNWLIFGSSLLGIDDVATNFETRLNHDNSTFTPLVSKEGEDVAEQFVGTFSRVFTLNNTQEHTFQIQSRNDGEPIGTNERLFESIFAMNLNVFSFFNATYSEDPVTIIGTGVAGDFNTELGSLQIPDTITNSTWFLFSGLGFDADKKKGFRQQLDNVDTVADQTSQTYDFSDGWDKDDILGNNIAVVRNVTSGIQVLDLDSHGDGNNEAIGRHISMFGFTLETLDLSDVTDNVFWSDNATIGQLDISPEVNATNNKIIWSDNATIGQLDISPEVDDTVFWGDFINMTFNISQEITDSVFWSDNSTPTVDLNQNVTDDIIWTDTPEITIDVSQDVPDDVVTWSDFVEMIVSFGQEVTDTIIWSDNSTATATISQEVDDTIIWSDNSTFNVDFNQDVTDDVIWTDDPIMTFDVSQDVPDDVVTWNDFVEITFNIELDPVEDTIIWTDNATSTFDLSQEVDDTIFWSDNANVTAITLSIGLPEDTVTWSDFVEMTLAINREVTDTVIWTDEVGSAKGSFFSEVTDFVGWLDGAGQGFDPSDVPIIIINEGDIITGGSGSGGGVGGSTPTTPDSDGDGFPDDVDACPNVVGIAPDGCPLVVPPVVIVPPAIDIPFELTQLDVIDDNIVLDTTSAQAQVEDLTIRWLGSEPITITSVEVGESPFEIIIEDIPVIIGNNQYGLTEYDIKYTVQEPFAICVNDFSFDCVAEVTYDIPVVVTGEIDGRIVITEGKIRVDNSDRLNPYYLILFGIFATLFIAIFVFKKRRKTHPRFKEKTVGKNRIKLRVIENQNTSQKAGTQRSKLTLSTKLNIINPKDRKKQDTFKFSVLSEKQRKEKKKKTKRNRLGF